MQQACNPACFLDFTVSPGPQHNQPGTLKLIIKLMPPRLLPWDIVAFPGRSGSTTLVVSMHRNEWVAKRRIGTWTWWFLTSYRAFANMQFVPGLQGWAWCCRITQSAGLPGAARGGSRDPRRTTSEHCLLHLHCWRCVCSSWFVTGTNAIQAAALLLQSC